MPTRQLSSTGVSPGEELWRQVAIRCAAQIEVITVRAREAVRDKVLLGGVIKLWANGVCLVGGAVVL